MQGSFAFGSLLNSGKSNNLNQEKSSKNDDASGIHKSDDNESAAAVNDTTVKHGYGSIGISVNNAIEVIE
ncbi:hypothetical protein ACFPES_00955 [Paenibacillus sp. GCM10023248]|nr:hypothetical protein [Paenibacillus sp. MAHUQ-63]